MKRLILIVLVLIVLSALCFRFCTRPDDFCGAGAPNSAGTVAQPIGEDTPDSYAEEDLSAILQFIHQNVQGAKIKGASLDSNEVQVKRVFHLAPNLRGSRFPVLASDLLPGKRVAWTLQCLFPNPLGTDLKSHPSQIVLTFALSSHAQKSSHVMALRIARQMGVELGKSGKFHGHWLLVSYSLDNITLTFSDAPLESPSATTAGGRSASGKSVADEKPNDSTVFDFTN